MPIHYLNQCWNVVNTLRPRQNGRHFADDTFKRIFLNENVEILIKISLKFVPKGPINNIPALVEVMAWRQPGNKPLTEPMVVTLLTHICVTRPQWVNWTPRNKFQWNFNRNLYIFFKEMLLKMSSTNAIQLRLYVPISFLKRWPAHFQVRKIDIHDWNP